MFWKSRDRSGAHPVEFLYYDDGRIPFVGVTDANNAGECYGGVNLAGFAVENTDAHNVNHGPHNDGLTMYEALATCRTVVDFDSLLTRMERQGPPGRYGYNYGVIDAFGGAAIFESHRYSHYRYDAIDSPHGFLIRTNHAYSGDPTGDNDQFYGLNRHDRGMEGWKAAVEANNLTPQYVLQTVVRNLAVRDLDPNPLPFEGYYRSYPYGAIPNDAAICRATTCAVLVVHGVTEEMRPEDAIMWSMAGSPLGGVATPLWARAGSVPPEYDGQQNSRLNTRIISLRNWTYAYPNLGSLVDTWRLINPDGTGLWDFELRLESWVFDKTEAFLNSPDFSYDRLTAFQNNIARQVADSLDAWKPHVPVTEVRLQVADDYQIMLSWSDLERDAFGRAGAPSNYQVYACEHPFVEGERGELISNRQDHQFSDTPESRGRFYRVVAGY